MNTELTENPSKTPAEDQESAWEQEEHVGEKEAANGAQHCDLRFLLRRLKPEGFARHRAAKWTNRKCFSKNADDATFNRLLMFFFLITLGLTLISIMVFEQFLNRIVPPPRVVDPTKQFEMEQRIIRLLSLLAVVVVVAVVSVLVKMRLKNAGSAPPRREEVQTISAAVQQV